MLTCSHRDLFLLLVIAAFATALQVAALAFDSDEAGKALEKRLKTSTEKEEVALADNLKLKPDRVLEGKFLHLLEGKYLEMSASYRTESGAERVVFVYQPKICTVPGANPETVVITDSEYRVLAWRALKWQGTTTLLIDASLKENQVLVLVRYHRFEPKLGKHSISLAGDTIHETGMEWVDKPPDMIRETTK